MAVTGLTSEEVAERTSAGLINSTEEQVSRSYRDIIVKNVFTSFNIILFALGAILLALNEPLNALSATGVILVNILVATVQEVKAKRRLDKIALLLRPKVTVLRDGSETEIDQSKVVKDDIIHLVSGDQALVDGELLEVRSLEIDESLLTGESSTVRKKAGDEIYSGSFCVTGDGYYKVTAFGPDSYAYKLLSSAKKYTTKNTPLQMETTAITEALLLLAFVFLAIVTALNLLKGLPIDTEIRLIINSAVIVLDIVPIALFLLIVITYMIAAIRMSDAGVLLQRSNAVESLSHVDTICMDKTGTITSNKLVFEDVVHYIDGERADRLIAGFCAATGSKNRTVKAMADHFGPSDMGMKEEIQFSSERKYSAVLLNDGTALFMGAWSSLSEHCRDTKDAEKVLEEASRAGLRGVVMFEGRADMLYDGKDYIIPELSLVAVVKIRDEVRPDCRETIGVFLDSGMDLKVISGDDPETVDALFTLADIPGDRKIISGPQLDALSGEERDRTILETNIFGRMRPDHKEEIISTLKHHGRYVAMVGDGVNDVKSIKEAQVGIAMQSGSGATRGVADMVLVDDRFSALPKALIEGRKTVSGMRDILKLYLTRNFVLSVLVLVLLIGGMAIGLNITPLLPTQNAYYAVITVSISAFLMAIWAMPSKNEGSVLPGVLRYALPTACLISAFALCVYVLFWTGTMEGWIDISYSTQQLMDFGWPQLKDPTDPMLYDPARIAEINARNGMIAFLVMAGITQLLMITPKWKFFSVDGRLHDDIKPTILVLLLYGLMALVYCVPWVCDNILFLTIFPWQYFAGLALLTAVWFLVTRTILRNARFARINGAVEGWFDRKLNKAYGRKGT